jgi:hypothetical protein
MKKLISTHFIFLAIFAFTVTAGAAAPVKIEVIYLNHGPMQPTLRELRALLPEYGDRIAAHWYDFESEDGSRFKAEMGIRRHTPLIIYINGQSTFQMDGRSVAFSGFPTGSGPATFQGKWKIDDLKAVLEQMMNGN